MSRRIVVFAGLWAALAAVGSSAQAQGLGVWQPLADERVASGELLLGAPIAPADPVRALPTAVKSQHFGGFSSAKFAIEPGGMSGLVAQPVPAGNLMLRGYDPDVPLPHPDLAEMAPSAPRWEGPRPYVHVQREERGGVLGLNGVLGLTVPFPTSRAADR